MQFSVGSTAALDENTFYIGGSTGVHRSTNGGKTWHRFNTRFESRVDGLISFMVNPTSNLRAALYARVGPNLVKSTDGGRSWDAVNVALEINRLLSERNTTYRSSGRSQWYALCKRVAGVIPSLFFSYPLMAMC